MRLFGFEISRQKKSLAPVDNRGGWLPLIREPYAGAWQNNDEMRADTALAYYAVYACVTLVSADIGKLWPVLKQLDGDGIWQETTSPAFSPVLRRPNRYQNHIQFKEWWITSKLAQGNTYVLKQRDNRGVVTALYILDPLRCQPLVAPDGSVYYQLSQDDLNNLESSIVVPASEIIHDRMNCLFHPLVGVSPIYASGLAANQGLSMQRDSNRFFSNGARPGGILSAPGAISDETAARLKEKWDNGYTGVNAGKVAVVGDGLKFEPMRATAVDSQLIEQMKMSAEVVCAAFHVPAFKIGAGTIPAGQKVEDLNQIYYSDCLQTHIESMELCLDEGLSLPDRYGVELDLDGLLRMDTATLYATLGTGVKNSLLAPNEARKKIGLKPLEGGNSIYLQQQNYSLEALARRDAQEDPFGTAAPEQAEPDPEEPKDEEVADQARMLALLVEKEMSSANHA
ncbi:phage portal protein [Pseudomonas luteola]|uniref:phage portal protein n=1 Tax=Pseudomonas luteola TaxID=47886 RepID=UPI00123BABCD|nr:MULTISPECIES: phage portal protein [Pseudomonas]MBA1249851.1 phage portal protein [Pseudomonas zeshuii]QEU28842.1 phage portal protein [Pseudomonas luteola]